MLILFIVIYRLENVDSFLYPTILVRIKIFIVGNELEQTDFAGIAVD